VIYATAAVSPGKKKTRYPVCRRLGGQKGRSGRVRKNLAPTGTRSPDRPYRSEYLYQLSYPGRINSSYVFQIPGFAMESNTRRFLISYASAGNMTMRCEATFSAHIYCSLSLSLSLHFCQRTAVFLRQAILSVLKSAEIQ